MKLFSAAVRVYWADVLGLRGQVDVHVHHREKRLGTLFTIPNAAAARLR